MRKFAGVLVAALLAMIFAGCGGNGGEAERELDFRSMRDVELDVIISLGDSRERVERLLGEPTRWSASRVEGDRHDARRYSRDF